MLGTAAKSTASTWAWHAACQRCRRERRWVRPEHAGQEANSGVSGHRLRMPTLQHTSDNSQAPLRSGGTSMASL